MVKRKAKVKALALLSGGLDSTLAVKLILDQGIDVEALNFVSPFCLCGKSGCGAAETAKTLCVPLKVIRIGEEYLRMVRKPRHGYGRNMNPCIDCRIFMLKKAKRYARETGASFIFTGEVLNERPMSQHLTALKTIEKEAGLMDEVLRPLSAKLLPETLVEQKGLVDREKLMAIRGRSRKPQIELAKRFNIKDYPCPAGGCLLTYKEFADKLKDLFDHKKHVSVDDVNLLKVGRHFRFGKNKIIVGRNKSENETLIARKKANDYFFEVPDCGSPITILQGPKTKKGIEKAAALTAYYSDMKESKTQVRFGKNTLDRSIIRSILNRAEVDKLRIAPSRTQGVQRDCRLNRVVTGIFIGPDA
jgi:tRNA U34 2-thiouridine synthase MnmA/TrmU